MNNIEDIPHDALLVLNPYISMHGTMVAVYSREIATNMSSHKPLGNILVTDEELLLLSLGHIVFKNIAELVDFVYSR